MLPEGHLLTQEEQPRQRPRSSVTISPERLIALVGQTAVQRPQATPAHGAAVRAGIPSASSDRSGNTSLCVIIPVFNIVRSGLLIIQPPKDVNTLKGSATEP
jgi:hypothetical protein